MLRTCKTCGLDKPYSKGVWVTSNGKPIGKLCLACNSLRTIAYYAEPAVRAAKSAQIAAHLRELVLDPETGETIKRGALRMRERYRSGKYTAYLEAKPIAKLRARIATAIYASLQRKGWTKRSNTQTLLGCSFEEFLAHLRSTFPDWETCNEPLELDHIIPCCYANTIEELEALQHWSNFQWLPKSANRSKQGTIPANAAARLAELMTSKCENSCLL